MLKASNLSKKVYEHFKEKIYAGGFPTMSVVYETQLAEELGVSRTPVREAIRMLQHEGLLEQLSGGGIRAHLITSRDIQDASDARLSFELLTVQLAAERITERQADELQVIISRTETAIHAGLLGEIMKENELFHHFIATCTGNRLMEQLIDRIYTYLKSHNLLQRLASQGNIHDILETIYVEHLEIAGAIRVHDATLAVEVMKRHLKGVSNLYQESLT
jgi:DNA-binding GntR family transcriptional regulator